ncbi:hypothetical protein G5714_007998 [Onychostoma macrolepis]|uniref:Integrase core domain-containing protein n=1 Tax=Onychostoma macrolepis TaxID=369639 RepID=A0A7J6CUD6_9TELE|nr:hypothetical protein G5714_007998 [Onychostoma macrolepis]
MSDDDLHKTVAEIQNLYPNSGYRMMHGHLSSRGVKVQTLSLRTIRRRQYSVPTPKAMWHIDGNHKLIRWRIVVHGGIDGFSRMIVYLKAATKINARTGIYNYRIERPWRDDYDHVLDLFSCLFLDLEADGTLNPDNEVHLFALHWTYLPQLQRHLAIFQEVDDDYGVDWEGPHSCEEEGVTIPEVQLTLELTNEEIASLPHPEVPLLNSVQIYLDTVN